MRHIKTKTAQTILFAGIALFTFCASARADIDWKRMKRDLAIQESILDQFFDEKKGSTTGLYIENYGVLLIASGGIKYGEGGRLRVRAIGGESIDIAIPDKSVWQIQKSGDKKNGKNKEEEIKGVLRIQKIKRDKSSENEEEEILEFSMTEKKPEVAQREKKEQNEALKKQVTEFLSTYANAIGQLKDDDRVTIILHPTEHDFHSFSFSHFDRQRDALNEEASKIWMEAVSKAQEAKKQLETLRIRMEASKKEPLEATVTKRDIEAYNRGKIDEQTFHDRITFREHEPQPSLDKRIDIMADILTNILKKDTDLRFLSGTQCTGFYQKGIGALFLISQKGNLFSYDWHKRESDEKNKIDGLYALKTAVIETLGDYGPTLRGLSSKESIIVHINLIGQSHYKIGHKDKTTDIQHPDRILFRVTKRDIEAYASQKIDLDTLKKRVAITEM